MWNEPSASELEKMPKLYETERTPLEKKIVGMHFFLGGSDWYAVEYSPEERIFFGYAILNNNLQNAEWGYFSFDELRELKVRSNFEVDRDLHWTPTRVQDVDRIGGRR